MRTAKEKLVERLISGNDDIFTEFVIVGLEEGLKTIVDEIIRLLGKKSLSWVDREALNELYHDGKATIRVLKYYAVDDYAAESQILDGEWDKLIGEVF